jgi:hypothetical protein
MKIHHRKTQITILILIKCGLYSFYVYFQNDMTVIVCVMAFILYIIILHYKHLFYKPSLQG